MALPIALFAGPAAVRRLSETERALVNGLLRARVPIPAPLNADATICREQVAFLAGKLVITVCAGVVCAVPALLFGELLVRSLEGLTGGGGRYLGPWSLGRSSGICLLVLAVAALLLSIGALDAAATVLARVSRRALASRPPSGMPVREVLAERLGDRTLAPALDALAQRSTVPVELDLRLNGRLAKEIETAGYFVVAEALTNVVKYACATHARLIASDLDGVLWLEVRDDGVGGADPASGSGLNGLSDRVAALDGELSVDSPLGGGTRVRASIPSSQEQA